MQYSVALVQFTFTVNFVKAKVLSNTSVQSMLVSPFFFLFYYVLPENHVLHFHFPLFFIPSLLYYLTFQLSIIDHFWIDSESSISESWCISEWIFFPHHYNLHRGTKYISKTRAQFKRHQKDRGSSGSNQILAGASAFLAPPLDSPSFSAGAFTTPKELWVTECMLTGQTQAPVPRNIIFKNLSAI